MLFWPRQSQHWYSSATTNWISLAKSNSKTSGWWLHVSCLIPMFTIPETNSRNKTTCSYWAIGGRGFGCREHFFQIWCDWVGRGSLGWHGHMTIKKCSFKVQARYKIDVFFSIFQYHSWTFIWGFNHEKPGISWTTLGLLQSRNGNEPRLQLAGGVRSVLFQCTILDIPLWWSLMPFIVSVCSMGFEWYLNKIPQPNSFGHLSVGSSCFSGLPTDWHHLQLQDVQIAVFEVSNHQNNQRTCLLYLFIGPKLRIWKWTGPPFCQVLRVIRMGRD